MRRREFIVFLGGFASASLVAACAQKSDGVRRIGVLWPLAAEDPQGQERDAAFRQALKDRGWSEGRNVSIDVRWAAGDLAQARRYAAELVTLAPDVILAGGGLVVSALQQATRTVPIVFTATRDPVLLGIVASLAHPGGNTTGFINYESSFSAKWLELLKEIAPGVARAGLLRDPGFREQIAAMEAVAPSLHVETIAIDMHDAGQIERAITAFAAEPVVYPVRFDVLAGGLISYGPNSPDQYRRAADYVDRILSGAKPADLPVQTPARYEMVINLTTARALGLTIPRTVLRRADEIIE